MLRRQSCCQRAFSAAGEAAQDDAIKISFETLHLHLFYRSAATIVTIFTLIRLRFNPYLEFWFNFEFPSFTRCQMHRGQSLTLAAALWRGDVMRAHRAGGLAACEEA